MTTNIIEIDGYEIFANNETEAKNKLKKHMNAGLTDKFLKDSLTSIYPLEHWVTIQS
jgi:hypothetical protein